jgi:hypothetical protein
MPNLIGPGQRTLGRESAGVDLRRPLLRAGVTVTVFGCSRCHAPWRFARSMDTQPTQKAHVVTLDVTSLKVDRYVLFCPDEINVEEPPKPPLE